MSDFRRIAIVTGSNTGIGRETALALAKDGMKVFLACRSANRAHQAATYIREACPRADVEILLLDLGTLESVRKCASEFKSRNLPLHLLVNNAGVVLGTPWYTAEGIGGSAQINYLGPYVLTRLLEDELVAGAPSRVVNVSSSKHRWVDFPNPPDKFLWDFKSGDYPEAKLANVLFTYELQRRWQGKGIHACAVDPDEIYINIETGAVASDIWRRSSFSRPPLSWLANAVFAPTWDGAIPVIHGATAPLVDTEKKMPLHFFARGLFAWSMVVAPSTTTIGTNLAAVFDWPLRNISKGFFLTMTKEVPSAPATYSTELASKLWTLSACIANFSDGQA